MKVAAVAFAALALAIACLGGQANAQDDDKLNIWLVAHTHDDTGWLRTIDEYYVYEVQYILDSVVDSLAANPNRKFIEVEMAFFTRWWREQTAEKQSLVRSLVNAGQLEFINGGWCMNDEAVPTYYQTIDQMTLGHEFLQKTFGDAGKPKIGWHIDPFGHSNVMAALMNMTGFDAFFINRIDFRLKNEMKAAGGLEFVWQGSASLGDTNSIWIHMMDEHYCTPDGFNWEHGVTQNLPSGDGPPPIVFDPPSEVYPANAFERAEELVEEARRRAKAYKTNNILIPFGCDFTFQNANMMFKNMDRLIDAINLYSSTLNATARYSTLSDYAAHVTSLPTPDSPPVTSDFFPYADNSQSYWTGYFTSRPNLKSQSRDAHSLLRSVDTLHALSRVQFGVESGDFFDDMAGLRAVEGVVQHHDGTTGTHRQLVGDDYVERLTRGGERARERLADMVGYFATMVAEETTEAAFFGDRETFDAELGGGRGVRVAIHNPLGWSRDTVVGVRLGVTDDVIVTDVETGEVVEGQVTTSEDGTYQMLYVHVTLPGLGFVMVDVVVTNDKSRAVPRSVTRHVTAGLTVENEHVRLTFDNVTNLLSTMETLGGNGTVATVSQHFLSYSSVTSGQTSGAYIFRPRGIAVEHVIIGGAASTVVEEGPLVTEVRQTISSLIKQSLRLFHGLASLEGGAVDATVHVAALPVDTEVIVRFSTDLATGGEFYTDNNGLEMQRRVNNPDGRPGDSDLGVKIAGNFYPAVSRVAIKGEDDDVMFGVASQSTHAAASLDIGQVEIMLHRRCSRDDARGMSEALTDLLPYSADLRIVFGTNQEAARLLVRHSNVLNFPPNTVYAYEDTDIEQATFAPMGGELPENVHVVSLSARDAESDDVIVRLLNPFAVGDHVDLSLPAVVDVRGILDEERWVVGGAQRRTLTLMHAIGEEEMPGEPLMVTLNPIDIVSYVVDLQ